MEVQVPFYDEELLEQPNSPCPCLNDKENSTLEVLSVQNTDASSLCLEATFPHELTHDVN